jgi:hypothetical protein
VTPSPFDAVSHRRLLARRFTNRPNIGFLIQFIEDFRPGENPPK